MAKRTSVTRGQRLRIPADEYTELLRAERLVKSNRRNLSGDTIEHLFPPLITWVKNTTASTVPAFGVLGLDGPITDPTSDARSAQTISFRSTIRFKGIAPSTSTPHYGKYAILQEPAKAGQIVRAVLAGGCLCKLDITHADDFAAEIANTQTSFLQTSALGSAKVLWKESGTGSDKWGMIQVGSPILTCVGKADGAIALDAADGVVDVWHPDFSGATGQSLAACHNFTADIATGDYVSVTMILPKGIKIVSPLRCAV